MANAPATRGGYLETCLVACFSKSRLGLGLGLLCLESRSRRCSDVGKAQSKYVMSLSKNRLFVRFFAIRLSWFFLICNNHNRIEP